MKIDRYSCTYSCLAVFLAFYPMMNRKTLRAEEIAVHKCPQFSGTYRFDGLKDKSCVINNRNQSAAYPIPLAIQSVWHIQPGKTFKIEQDGCEKLIIRYEVDNSIPSEHVEEIPLQHIETHRGASPLTSVEYQHDSISFRQGNDPRCVSGSGLPGSTCSWINQASFTLAHLPTGNLLVTSQKRDIGASTAAPFFHWDTTSFKCELTRVDFDHPSTHEGLRDHIMSPNETLQSKMRPHSDESDRHPKVSDRLIPREAPPSPSTGSESSSREDSSKNANSAK